MLATATRTNDGDGEEQPSERGNGSRPLGVADSRKINLRAVIAQWGGPTQLAKKLRYSGPSYLLQMVSPKAIRPITEKTARKIERELDLPAGWLDQEHGAAGSSVEPVGAVVLEQELLAKVVSAVGTTSKKMGLELNPTKFADIVVLVYEDALHKGKQLDERTVDRALRLAK